MASRARQVALLWLLAVLSRGRAEPPLPRITQVDIRGASRMGDTHAVRLSGRLGLATPHNVEKKYADKIERELLDVVARKDRTLFCRVVHACGPFDSGRPPRSRDAPPGCVSTPARVPRFSGTAQPPRQRPLGLPVRAEQRPARAPTELRRAREWAPPPVPGAARLSSVHGGPSALPDPP